MTISSEVRRVLGERFGALPFEFSGDEDWIARLKAPYGELGSLEIAEDDGEVTVYIGDVAHGHFYPMQKRSPTRDVEVAEDLGDFLERLFADRVVMRKSAVASSWWYVDDASSVQLRSRGDYFLWSRPLRVG